MTENEDGTLKEKTIYDFSASTWKQLMDAWDIIQGHVNQPDYDRLFRTYPRVSACNVESILIDSCIDDQYREAKDLEVDENTEEISWEGGWQRIVKADFTDELYLSDQGSCTDNGDYIFRKIDMVNLELLRTCDGRRYSETLKVTIYLDKSEPPYRTDDYSVPGNYRAMIVHGKVHTWEGLLEKYDETTRFIKENLDKEERGHLNREAWFEFKLNGHIIHRHLRRNDDFEADRVWVSEDRKKLLWHCKWVGEDKAEGYLRKEVEGDGILFEEQVPVDMFPRRIFHGTHSFPIKDVEILFYWDKDDRLYEYRFIVTFEEKPEDVLEKPIPRPEEEEEEPCE